MPQDTLASASPAVGASLNHFQSPSLDSQPALQKLEELERIQPETIIEAQKLVGDMTALTDANALYQKCLQLLKLGGLEAEIPRLVVFGQQSMGKTTLLGSTTVPKNCSLMSSALPDFIMGGPIGYSSNDTGTMQPVVIMLKPASARGTPQGPEPGNGSSGVECAIRGRKLDIRDLQREMKHIMTRSPTVTSEELEIEIAVPGGVHAVFVDLPGIKDDSKEGAALTRDVVRNYVSNNPNDLYILVKRACDDPANWPWSLREFILSSPPAGLGLRPQQTIVVGTRAKEFLLNEKNDVSTQQQLFERVQKRAVCGPTGLPLPLYLLELFSLSIQEKEMPFPLKRQAMQRQATAGQRECQRLLRETFTGASREVQAALLRSFDADTFKANLNAQFQSLLSAQLEMLERRLVRKRLGTEKEMNALSQQLTTIQGTGPQSIRECIKLYIRELVQMITELATGNYMIIPMPEYGNQFLDEYGGSLGDNLADGHQLALEIFPQKELYDPNFLTKTTAYAEHILRQSKQQQELARSGRLPPNPSVLYNIAKNPCPDVAGRLQPGQFVRFFVAKDATTMLGHVESMICSKDPAARETPEGLVVMFYFMTQDASAKQQCQSKKLEASRVQVVLPLTSVMTPSCLPPREFRCWRKIVRSDSWIGLTPVMLLQVELAAAPAPSPMRVRRDSEDEKDSNKSPPSEFGNALYLNLVETTGDLSGSVLPGTMQTCNIEDLFCDAATVRPGDPNIFSQTIVRNNLTPLQEIAGDYAETRLLNQLALNYLGRWLKFHISQLQPDRKFSDRVLLQLMRSVKHVVDKADWEPLVADLLQANVRGGLLHLTRLASCATAVALRRILRAGIHEMQRQVEAGQLHPMLRFLSSNARFSEEVQETLENFCRDRAFICANAMRDLVFEQTHAIHFEMVEDFFDGCRFLAHHITPFHGVALERLRSLIDTSLMDDITQRVREGLVDRKHRLGAADVYSRRTTNISQTMIYEEVIKVRIQFWIVKMLLSAPLTTKLYIHFIKDIKDRTQVPSQQRHSFIYILVAGRFGRQLLEPLNCICWRKINDSSVRIWRLRPHSLLASSGFSDRRVSSPMLLGLRLFSTWPPTSRWCPLKGILSEHFKPDCYIQQILRAAVECVARLSRTLDRTDENLLEYYDLAPNRNALQQRYDTLKDIKHYIGLALNGVSHLRAQMLKSDGRSVDFLARLSLGIPVDTGDVTAL